ncbi:pro-melanin-concentrating hormone, like [Eucyclogobius newberryi]|uniref:pro-melanin-concentrating hormone, like n=1 Tax=Eucyclogobius newberryi TaxID=166745 RepID=UPI003B5C1A62
MKAWLSSSVLVAALVLECCALSAAVPMSKGEDGSLEQDALASLLSDDMTDINPSDIEAGSKPRLPRVIVVGDPSLWQGLRAMHSGAGLFKRRVEEEHQDLNIPILRRDTMRCMVGRVYRPCWEV